MIGRRLLTRFSWRIVVVCALALFGRPSRAASQTVTTCEAANPFDTLPDDVALQSCLDDYDWVLLKPETLPGYVGYLVGDTIKLKRAGALLTSASYPSKAKLLAAPSLNGSMLRVSGVDGFEISFLRFDGNRENRSVRDKPCDAVHNFRNVELAGVGFHVRYVESFGAVCGSAMTVGGSSRFEIYGSMFYDNGRQPEEANGLAGLWSDGLTVFGCGDSTIRDNAFWDNTDIDLGVNGGASCSVYRNTISHFAKYAFAGLVIGDPTATGGEFSDNRITAGRNLLGFGIVVGCRPWAQCQGGSASNVTVYDNIVTGAVVNLAVDGLQGGWVHDNTMSGARGTRVLNCPGVSLDYAVAHVDVNARIQSGYVAQTFAFGSSCGSD
jgi:hypothetical protein